MSKTRRIFVSIGAPVIVVGGLLFVWGLRNAAAMKEQIEGWAYSLEHSAEPVTMHIPFIPMYVDGQKVGKLETVVVQREQAGAVDSVQLVIALRGGADAEGLGACSFQLDPEAFEDGPWGFKRAVRCVADVSDMVRFGSVVLVSEADLEGPNQIGLYLEADHVPCEHMSHAESGPCVEFSSELHRLRDEIRNEVRMELRDARTQIRRSRRQRER